MIDEVIGRVGMWKSRRVMTFYLGWVWEAVKVGRDVSIEEYAAGVGVSLATAYRELALWREALPAFKTPGVYVEALGFDLATLAREDVSQALALPLPAGS
jgi:hypothetical protein